MDSEFDKMAMTIFLKMIEQTYPEPSSLSELALSACEAAATIYFYQGTQQKADSDKPEQETQ